MSYFITSREDLLTSAIELAQVKRMHIFDSLKINSQIVTLQYNWAHYQVEKKLGVTNRVVNLFQHFQQLPYHYTNDDQSLIDRLLNQPGYQVARLVASRDGKQRIIAHLNGQRLYYVDYRDRFGFTDRRDFYDNGCLTYTEFFEDRSRVVTRQYYDGQGHPKIIYHYRGGEGNTPVLCLIQLFDQGNWWTFDNEAELRAYFLDGLAKADPQAVFISDRSDYTMKEFALMHEVLPRYQVFHSAFTEDGRPNGKLFTVYEPIKQALQDDHLTGLISSTQQESADAGKRFATPASYAIPVTYIPDKLLQKKIPFDQRKPGQLIAVARLTNVKRLDHLINTVILLRKKHPAVDLKIYGYDDEWNNYATSHALKKLVRDKQAGDYIHFCGYQHDLTTVYETAQVEVLTSSYEGFAMALLEAQGHGCPAVSYNINYGPNEIIEDQVSGRLLPAGDVHALYTVLDDLLSHPEILKSYANHAQSAAAKYSFENVAKKWHNFIAAEASRGNQRMASYL